MMYLREIILASALILAPTLALADPTGTFDVEGTNADNGGTYTGTVKVTRTGETYSVVWNIGGVKSVGTGIGARFAGDNDFSTGAASDDDTGISVGYVSKDSFGIATYYRQADGSWDGVWTYGGSKTVTKERWTRK